MRLRRTLLFVVVVSVVIGGPMAMGAVAANDRVGPDTAFEDSEPVDEFKLNASSDYAELDDGDINITINDINADSKVRIDNLLTAEAETLWGAKLYFNGTGEHVTVYNQDDEKVNQSNPAQFTPPELSESESFDFVVDATGKSPGDITIGTIDVKLKPIETDDKASLDIGSTQHVTLKLEDDGSLPESSTNYSLSTVDGDHGEFEVVRPPRDKTVSGTDYKYLDVKWDLSDVSQSEAGTSGNLIIDPDGSNSVRKSYTLNGTASLSVNTTAPTVDNVTTESGDTATVNVTFENTGQNAATDITLNTTQIKGTNVSGENTTIAGPLSTGESTSKAIDFDVAQATPPGKPADRVMEVSVQFTRNGGTQRLTKRVGVGVNSSAELDLTADVVDPYILPPGDSEAFNITAELTGNDDIDALDVSVPDAYKQFVSYDSRPEQVAAGESVTVNGTITVPEDADMGSNDFNMTFDAPEITQQRQPLTVRAAGSAKFEASIDPSSAVTAVNNNNSVATLALSNPGNVPFEGVSVQVSENTTHDKDPSYEDELSIKTFDGTLEAGGVKKVPIYANVTAVGNETLDITYNVGKDDGDPYTDPSTSNSATTQLTIEGVELNTALNETWEETTSLPLDAGSGDTTAPIQLDVDVGGSRVTDSERLSFGAELTSDGAGTFDATVDASHIGNGTYNLTVTPEKSITDDRTYDLSITVTDSETSTSKVTTQNAIRIPDETRPSVTEIRAERIDMTGISSATNDIGIDVSDNDVSGIKRVTLNVTAPNGTVVANKSSGSGSLTLTGSDISDGANESTWETDVSVTDTGVYKLRVTAVDKEENSVTKTARFRAAEKVTFNTTVTDGQGKSSSNTSVKMVDADTKEVIDPGSGSASVLNGTYDVSVEHDDGYNVTMTNSSITGQSDSLQIDPIEQTGSAPQPAASQGAVKAVGAEVNLGGDEVQVTFNYSDVSDSDFNPANTGVGHCKSYDMEDGSCDGDVQALDSDDISVNYAEQTITAYASSTSSFTLYNSPDNNNNNNNDGKTIVTSSSSSSASLDDETQEALEKLSEQKSSIRQIEAGNKVTTQPLVVSTSIQQGETITTALEVSNEDNEDQTYSFEMSGEAAELVAAPESVELASNTSTTAQLEVSSSDDSTPQLYAGTLRIYSGSIETKVPVNIRVVSGPNPSIDLSAELIGSSVEPGSDARISTTVNTRDFSSQVEVPIVTEVIDLESRDVIATNETKVNVSGGYSGALTVPISENVSQGTYDVRVTAAAPAPIDQTKSQRIALSVKKPFAEQRLYGVTYANVAFGGLLFVLSTGLLGAGYTTYRRRQEAKKRYSVDLDKETIPQGGSRQAHLGKLADTNDDTYIDLDDLTQHALVAGATGTGKTVTSQDIAEEALMAGANVIVIDPTAQWSGFLDPCKDKNMLSRYDKFGLTQADARGFDGNIRAVEQGETIDVKPYLQKESEDEDGEITVFGLHKLDNANIDTFVADTIEQVFEANLDESDELETLIVFDESHRLLERFGGNKQGLNQLERGAREFRKWGVGIMAISQVVADFPEEVQANIGTTIQMRTQYEDDLKRIRDRFGEDTVVNVAKAKTGNGMLQNTEYNRGEPYFVEYRPLLHRPSRLTDKKLEQYEQNNRRVSAIESVLEEMPEDEAYDYQIEVKLMKQNIQKGSFNMVETYYEEVRDDLINEADVPESKLPPVEQSEGDN